MRRALSGGASEVLYAGGNPLGIALDAANVYWVSSSNGAVMKLPLAGGAPALLAIRALFPTPEDINDDVRTAPSKRIAQLAPGYNKPTEGSLGALAIGLDTIRACCPLFNEWLTKLEQLGTASPSP